MEKCPFSAKNQTSIYWKPSVQANVSRRKQRIQHRQCHRFLRSAKKCNLSRSMHCDIHHHTKRKADISKPKCSEIFTQQRNKIKVTSITRQRHHKLKSVTIPMFLASQIFPLGIGSNFKSQAGILENMKLHRCNFSNKITLFFG